MHFLQLKTTLGYLCTIPWTIPLSIDHFHISRWSEAYLLSSPTNQPWKIKRFKVSSQQLTSFSALHISSTKLDVASTRRLCSLLPHTCILEPLAVIGISMEDGGMISHMTSICSHRQKLVAYHLNQSDHNNAIVRIYKSTAFCALFFRIHHITPQLFASLGIYSALPFGIKTNTSTSVSHSRPFLCSFLSSPPNTSTNTTSAFIRRHQMCDTSVLVDRSLASCGSLDHAVIQKGFPTFHQEAERHRQCVSKKHSLHLIERNAHIAQTCHRRHTKAGK